MKEREHSEDIGEDGKMSNFVLKERNFIYGLESSSG